MIRTTTCMTFSLLLALLAPPGVTHAADWPDLSASPPNQGGGSKDAAVIVGIERYLLVAPVPGAVANANDWYTWLVKSRGLKPSRVSLLRDTEGSLERIRRQVERAADQVKAGGTLWFVFIGHGAPSKDGRDGVLVGSDAAQHADSLYARSLPKQDLLSRLSKGQQARTVVVIDACFSGRTQQGETLVKGLQPLMLVRPGSRDIGSTLILTAAASDQFAGPLPGLGRPALSYLALGALRGWADEDRDGRVSALETLNYAREALQTLVVGRSQTPELDARDPGVVLSERARERGPDLATLRLRLVPGGGSSRHLVAPPVTSGAGGPVIRSGSATQALGSLVISASPKRLAALEVTDPAGKTRIVGSPYQNPAAAVGQWKVTVRAQGYADKIETIYVPPDEDTLRQIKLEALGGLSIVGSPKGAAVTVTSPGGETWEGGLPWSAEGLPTGVYRVAVARDGYSSFEDEVRVSPGGTKEVSATLQKLAAAWLGQGGGSAGAVEAGKAGVAWVTIPGGSFRMGSDGGGGDEKPVHAVRVPAFQLAATEVTVAQYQACVQAGACTAPHWDDDTCYVFDGSNWKKGRLPDSFRGEDQPVVCVDWEQARAFARWVGGRLPSEAEWEFAARAGTTAPFSTGRCLGTNKANYNGAYLMDGCPKGVFRKKTTPVRTFAANPWGLFDLHGNVWEWTEDCWHGGYSGAPSDGSAWTTSCSGSYRVIRGGSWYNDAGRCRAAYRSNGAPGYRSSLLGFRPARSIP
jgi:formylglycine-generating enzyme required for sulfatase activity